MVDYINERRSCHIITLEDPIEYIHSNKKSIIIQREIGTDSRSFPAALKAALRQDPDIIMIGEMRDLETMETSLQQLVAQGVIDEQYALEGYNY